MHFNASFKERKKIQEQVGEPSASFHPVPPADTSLPRPLEEMLLRHRHRHRHHLLSRPRHSFPLAALGCVAMSTSSSPSSSTSTSAAADYHCRTKHSPTAGYARGPGRLDWANQPNPFLRFSPAPPLPLPNPPPLAPVPYPALFHSPPPPPQPLTLDSLSALLFHSLALSTWKSAGLSTWSLRVNPSSGNLHPTEAHLVFPHPWEVDRLAIAHYAPHDHLLVVRATTPIRDCSAILSAPGMTILALSSVFWQEAWKYGERALRYCNHDVGHALAAVALATTTLGWDARLLDGLSDEDLGRLVGVEKGSPTAAPEGLLNKVVKGKARWVERQHPDCAVLLFPVGSEPEVDHEHQRRQRPRLPHQDLRRLLRFHGLAAAPHRVFRLINEADDATVDGEVEDGCMLWRDWCRLVLMAFSARGCYRGRIGRRLRGRLEGHARGGGEAGAPD
jgi:nitroreductase